MEVDEEKIRWVAIYNNYLNVEFITEECGDNSFFFPDAADVRQAKFMIWLMKKYGVEKQFLQDLEKFEVMAVLKHR